LLYFRQQPLEIQLIVDTGTFIQILIMLLAGNGAPILAARLLGSSATLPVDLNRKHRDGAPVLGSSKTWRGVVAAVLISWLLALLFDYGALFGVVFGTLAMLGDLCSSFIKRRRKLEPSARSSGVDQLPESILPSLYACLALDLSWWWAPAWSLAFTVLQALLSKPLYHLHIRKRPY
jgi:CDP-2,3-bis-(O-geranylgeranyl)-sn-glycerol synthase